MKRNDQIKLVAKCIAENYLWGSFYHSGTGDGVEDDEIEEMANGDDIIKQAAELLDTLLGT